MDRSKRPKRPPGLKGKEIGLYYRSLQMKSTKKKNVTKLKIPPNIVSSLQSNLQSIRNIAKKLNICLPERKKLNFNGTPNNADDTSVGTDTDSYGTNYGCLKTSKSENDDRRTIEDTKQQCVSMDAEKYDNPVNSDMIAKLDSHDMKNFSVVSSEQTSSLTHLKKIKKNNIKSDNAMEDIPTPVETETTDKCTSDNIGTSGSDIHFVPKKKEKIDETLISSYTSHEPSTSKSSNFISTVYQSTTKRFSQKGAGDYKYGYEDIITGSFDEKLDKCLVNGGGVNIKDNKSHDLSVAIHEEYKDMLTKDKYKKLRAFRQKLPAFKKSKELLDVIKHNQVVVISGETGCGKSTQVPQIILDDAIVNNEGSNTKILVTQPRRIAASSLAMRVADERGERLGNSVGYAVRLEKVDPRPRGSIFFCTTGILLAELEVNQGLVNYSHVILDEVHERDNDIDLSMCMLKKVLKKRKDIKLILMSATIDANKLSEYFDNCVMMEIEGLAYPVQDIYLEDILQLTKFELPSETHGMRRRYSKKKSDKAKTMQEDMGYKAEIAPHLMVSSVRYKKSTTTVERSSKPTLRQSRRSRRPTQVSIHASFEEPNMKHIKMNTKMETRSQGNHTTVPQRDTAPWLESMKHRLNRNVYNTLQNSEIEDLNTELIYDLLKYICKGAPGAILVFLPGISDITNLVQMLNRSELFPRSRYEIYPLHSKLPSLEQHKIFQRPPERIRKIIIATNIAETSITIDDIVYVVDCGKIKYKGHNIQENVSTLKTEWISQANLRQRRGRAGRCQPGICYHLLTSYRAGQLAESLPPEMQRNDLLEPVLAIKKLRLGKAADAFNLMPAPPALETIHSAVRHLQQCGALDDKETLTPLGWHLARLPLHPAAGKLLLLGALFGCLDRAASVAAVWGFKDPFQFVLGKEKEVDEAKLRFAMGEPSDHVAMSEAIIQWEQIDSYQRRRDFAYENFLSMNTMQLLSEMKNQLGGNLKQMGFLSSGSVRSSWENRNAQNLSLFRAIVAASLFPNIGTVTWTNLRKRNRKPVRIRVQIQEGKVAVHPSSVMACGKQYKTGLTCNNLGANWLVYWLKQRSRELFLIDVTLVHTLPLLFFGEINVRQAEQPDRCFISIFSEDVRCKIESAELLFEVRSLLDSVLASKITAQHDRNSKLNEFENEVLNAVIKLISAEDEGVEYLDDDDYVSDSEQYENSHDHNWY